MQQIGFFIAKIIVRSTCSGHHSAHHQELKIYTDGCCLWYLGLWFTGRRSGGEMWVMCPVCGSSSPQTGNITHSPHQTNDL